MTTPSVGAKDSITGTYSGTALTLAAPVTTQASGSTFVIIASGPTGVTYTPADNKGNVYTLAVKAEDVSDGDGDALFYCNNAVGGANTIPSLGMSVHAGLTFRFVEVLNGVLDQSYTAQAIFSPYNIPVTPSQAQALVLAFFDSHSGNNVTVTANGGFTTVLTGTTSAVMSLTTTATGTYNAAPTIVPSGGRANVLGASFIASGSGTPGPTLTTPPTTLLQGSAYTIAGANLGSSGGTVSVGSVAATVTAQSATSVTFTVNLGTLKYGSKTVTYTRASDSVTTTFTAALAPASGFAYVDLTSVATSANRVTAAPDLAIGDELEYQTVGGKVTIAADATFSTTDETVTSFSVRANDGTGWGTSGTQTVSFTGPPDTTAPTAPNTPVLTATATTTVSMTLGGGTDAVGVTGYNVYQGGTKVTSSPVAAGTYQATGLSALTAYSFQATAVDAAGNESTKSSALSVTTGAVVDTTAPTVPASPAAAAASSSTIAVSWSASTDAGSGVASYRVAQSGGSTYTVPSSNTSFVVSGLAASTLYSFTVSAVDVAGNQSAQSSSVSATTQAAPAAGGRGVSRLIVRPQVRAIARTLF